LREVNAPTLLRQTANRWRQGCRSALRAGRTLPPGFFLLRFLVLISVRGWKYFLILKSFYYESRYIYFTSGYFGVFVDAAVAFSQMAYLYLLYHSEGCHLVFNTEW
jgi:hypothetical protein